MVILRASICSVLTVCFYVLARFAGSTAFPYIQPWVVVFILLYNFMVSIYLGWIVVPQVCTLRTVGSSELSSWW